MYLVASFFLTVAATFSGLPIVLAISNVEADQVLQQASFRVAASLFGASIVSLLPGILLVTRGPRWADRLVPPTDESAGHIESYVLLRIGLTLLGYFFVVTGLSATAASIVGVAGAAEFMRNEAWQESARGFVTLAAGIVIAVAARRAA